MKGTFSGFFTVIGIDNELNNAMIDLSNHFVSILALALLRERQSLMMTRTSLSNDFMCNILYGVVKEPEVIQSSFENAGIGKSSSYVVALFSANNTSADNDFFILRAHDHFSERIKNSCTVIDQDSIVLILADSPEKPAAESVLQVGSEFLKLSNARIGFSLAFENPVDTARFYLQAKAALRFGPLASPEESIFYHYGDVVLYDLIQHYGEAESLRTIMHPAILILQEYDEKHSVKLLPTLRVLLKNSNDTAVAAEELFLHRNTLYYRMKQISSITGIEFKDESSMEHLRISLLVNDILHQA